MPESPPTTVHHAVFLSYAHEDTEAARRIADALRAFGVEVWFDQSELRGGDAWDAKIKKQIRECALFLPLVSAQTQARAEGYFRREWNLAVERTRDMASGVAFIVPVVIDDTREADAAVPEEFVRYQWTRLAHGVPSPQFVEQVKRLLEAPRTAAPWGNRTRESLAGPVITPASQTLPGSATAKRVPGWVWGALVAVVALVAIAVFDRNKPAPPKPAAETKTASVAAKPPLDFASAKSIAVLPFENRSADKDTNALFTDGIHEDILTNLAHIRELRVVSRTSVTQYRATTKSIPQIARELGVTFILEGSVQRDGNKVRVTGQLIRAATDEHIWADKYDRDLTDIFAIQTELARAIATELHAALSPQEKSLIERRPTQNPAAYDLLLKARAGGLSLQRQEALLQAAVTLDGSFAEAWGELARVHARTHFDNIEHTPARLAKAKAAIDRAVALAPTAPEVVRNVGNYHLYAHRDYPRATEQFDQLARLRPNDSEVYFSLGEIQQRQARWVSAIGNFRKATQLDPGNLGYASKLTELLRGTRRWDEAIAEQQRIVGLRPTNSRDRYYLAMLHFQARGSRREMEEFFGTLAPEKAASPEMMALRISWARQSGNYPEAIRLHRAADPKTPLGVYDLGFAAALTLMASGDTAGGRAVMAERAVLERTRLQNDPHNTAALWQLGLAEAMLGHKEEALRCARMVADLIPESFDAVDGAAAGNKLALIYAWAGETDRAIAETARLLQTPASVSCVQFMKHDPWWHPLRGDPRFMALLDDPKNNAPLF